MKIYLVTNPNRENEPLLPPPCRRSLTVIIFILTGC